VILQRLSHRIINGDISDRFVSSEIGEVHCVVTSPPYFQQRKYGEDSSELGKEDSVEEYATRLCDIFDSIPLHPLGSLWVNIGDKRIKKGLSMAPYVFAIEMTRRGWMVADNVVWAKVIIDESGVNDGHCMVEPATWRLNSNGHESIFRFVRQKMNSGAWWDKCAVSIPRDNVEDIRHLPEELMRVHTSIEGRVLPNVWRMPMGQTAEKHYATFPQHIPERAIAASCPLCINPDGSVPRRVVEDTPYDEGRGSTRVFGKYTSSSEELAEKSGRQDTGGGYVPKKPVTVGWEPPLSDSSSPAVVLDPFCGSGTTGIAALKMGRSFVGVELYEEYCTMARSRCSETMDWLEEEDWNPWGELN